MSDDIDSVADFSTEVQQDAAEREDSEKEIYQSLSDIIAGGTDFPTGRTQKQPGVLKRPLRRTPLWLRMLILLMLAGIVILLIVYISGTLDKKDELQEKVNKLKDEIDGKSCAEGWRRFRCGCYFKSTEKKTWKEGRKDCRKKGSDLVIINSKKEQEFIRGLNCKGVTSHGVLVRELNCTEVSWIGLHRTGPTEWKWVDGSPLTETFWAEAHKDNSSRTNAVCCINQGKWIEGSTSRATWICEK